MAKLSSTSSPLLLLLPTLLLADDRVQLTSDGPAVLDAPITFTGKLIEPAGPDTQYRWRWFDTASPGHYKVVGMDLNSVVFQHLYNFRKLKPMAL